MKQQKMTPFLIVGLLWLLAGCAAAPSENGGSAAAVTQAPSQGSGSGATEGEEQSSPNPWKGGYEESPSELCPPGGERVERARFAPEPIHDEEGGWSNQGLFLNEQGELFRLVVGGGADEAGREAVNQYAQEVRICLDQVHTDLEDNDQPQDDRGEGAVQGGPPHPEDLVITLLFEGLVQDGRPEVGQKLVSTIVEELPPQDWASSLSQVFADEEGGRFIPARELLSERQRAYMLDFIIDPSINKGVTHQYKQYTQLGVIVTFSVRGDSGAGAVKGGLCRNKSLTQSSSIDHATTNDLRTFSDTLNATYDLGIRGQQNGSRYRTEGRWWITWDAPAPTGSTVDCTPPA